MTRDGLVKVEGASQGIAAGLLSAGYGKSIAERVDEDPRRTREPIAKDDPTSLASAEGWARREEEKRRLLSEAEVSAGGSDEVERPAHYTSHPSGIECIEVVEHLPFNVGNAIKYLWRAGLKTEDPTVDLRKADWYVRREIQRIERMRTAETPDQVEEEG